MRRTGVRLLVVTAAVVLLAGCTTGAEPATSAPGTPAASASPSSAPPTSAPSKIVPSTSAAAPSGDEPDRSWRTEVWRDVQLEVPARWALGYAPMRDAAGALLCGTDPPDAPRGASVGRPGYGSDVCLRVELGDLGMDRPGVWFGSPLPVGEAIAKTGLRQVTVEAGSSRVTVASKDEALLARILDSVEPVRKDGNGCPAQPRASRSYPREGFGETLSFSVCAYERPRSSRPWRRLWTAALPTARADRLLAAVADGEPGPRCRPSDGGQLVLLHVSAADAMGDRPLPRDVLVAPGGCASARQWGLEATKWVRLTPAMVAPWAVRGVSTYVYSHGLPRRLDRFFRPIWG